MNGNEKLSLAGKLQASDWDKITARAEALMHEHKFGCSESLLLAFQEVLGEGVLPPSAVAMASAFRGGMGGAGCVCGALAGAEMVMGAFFGYYGQADGRQDPEQTKKSRDLFKELHDEFRRANGATCCRSLTKNLSPGSPERNGKCSTLTRSAAFLAGGLIARQSNCKD